jgi:hypothetical protein
MGTVSWGGAFSKFFALVDGSGNAGVERGMGKGLGPKTRPESLKSFIQGKGQKEGVGRGMLYGVPGGSLKVPRKMRAGFQGSKRPKGWWGLR